MQPLLQKKHLNFEHDPDDHEDVQIDKLTPREHEIARLTSKGFSNKEIARILEISPHTVSTHLRRSFDKLGVQKRAALSAILAKATVQNKWDHGLLSKYITGPKNDLRTERQRSVFFASFSVEREKSLIVDGIGVDDLCRAL